MQMRGSARQSGVSPTPASHQCGQGRARLDFFRSIRGSLDAKVYDELTRADLPTNGSHCSRVAPLRASCTAPRPSVPRSKASPQRAICVRSFRDRRGSLAPGGSATPLVSEAVGHTHPGSGFYPALHDRMRGGRRDALPWFLRKFNVPYRALQRVLGRDACSY